MSDPTAPSMGQTGKSPRDVVRPLLRVRQIRDFTPQRLDPAILDALVDVARWSGSSRNEQPWRFIVIEDEGMIRRLHEAGMPQTRALATATAAIAIVLPNEPEREVSRAYDDGRVAERILIGSSLLGIGGAITWARGDVRAKVAEILGLPPDRFVRTIVALGHPTEAARRPKSKPGTARLPPEEVVIRERWPA